MRQLPMIVAWPLSAAGLGLLMWSGMTTALLQREPGGAAALHALQLVGVLLGAALHASGMALQRFPRTAARPRLQASRLARMLAWASLGIAVALGGVWLTGAWPRRDLVLAALGVALLGTAFAAVAVSAGAYARSPAPPAWTQPLVVPVHLLFAMSTGLALMYLLMDRLFVSGSDSRTMLATLTGLGICVALCKALYWRALDRTPAAGATPRSVSHARLAVLALVAGTPLLGWMLALPGGLPAFALLLAVAAALFAATVLEHRLFLDEGVTSPGTPGHAF